MGGGGEQLHFFNCANHVQLQRVILSSADIAIAKLKRSINNKLTETVTCHVVSDFQ